MLTQKDAIRLMGLKTEDDFVNEKLEDIDRYIKNACEDKRDNINVLTYGWSFHAVDKIVDSLKNRGFTVINDQYRMLTVNW